VSSGNYDISFRNGILTINTAATEIITNAVESSITSIQTTFNGTVQNLNGGTAFGASMLIGPGSGSTTVADFGMANFVSVPSQSAGTMSITSTSISSVSFDRAGGTSILRVGESQTPETMNEVGALSVFSREKNGGIVPQGSYIVKEGASTISLTEAPSSLSYSLDETGIYNAKMISFTMTLANGSKISLETAITNIGMLIIFAPDTVESLEMDQAVLMAMQAVHKEMNIDFKKIKTVLINKQRS